MNATTTLAVAEPHLDYSQMTYIHHTVSITQQLSLTHSWPAPHVYLYVWEYSVSFVGKGAGGVGKR